MGNSGSGGSSGNVHDDALRQCKQRRPVELENLLRELGLEVYIPVLHHKTASLGDIKSLYKGKSLGTVPLESCGMSADEAQLLLDALIARNLIQEEPLSRSFDFEDCKRPKSKFKKRRSSISNTKKKKRPPPVDTKRANVSPVHVRQVDGAFPDLDIWFCSDNKTNEVPVNKLKSSPNSQSRVKMKMKQGKSQDAKKFATIEKAYMDVDQKLDKKLREKNQSKKPSPRPSPDSSMIPTFDRNKARMMPVHERFKRRQKSFCPDSPKVEDVVYRGRKYSVRFKKNDIIQQCGWSAGYYKVEKLLGVGAFGEVHEVREMWRRHGETALREVRENARQAMKCVNLKRLEPEWQEREHLTLCKEARTLATVGDHPNITTLRMVMPHDDIFSLFSDLVEGGDLASMIEDDSLYEASSCKELQDRLLRFTIELAIALEHIHSKGVLHQDVKPANIMIHKSSKPISDPIDKKLLDKKVVLAPYVGGTEAFASPEIQKLVKHLAPSTTRERWNQFLNMPGNLLSPARSDN